MAKRQIIAVDIDEVLAYFVPAVVGFHNAHYATELTPDSFFSYEFHNVWGGTPHETMDKLDMFFDSTHFTEKLNPIPHALEALTELKKHFDLHIVTSRQHKIEEQTVSWINQHFPDIFAEIHLGNHYVKEGKSRTKSEICHTIGACLLIDDSVKYTLQCVRDNIPVILFGNYAWNRTEAEYSDITFVEYSDSLQISSTGGLLDKNDEKHTVYRVSNWNQVMHLIYATFGIEPNPAVDAKAV